MPHFRGGRGRAEIIAKTYDCLLDPSAWIDVIGRLTRATNSVSGCMCTLRDGRYVDLPIVVNADEEYLQRYRDTYSANDPIAHLGLLLGPGDIVSAGSVTRSAKYRASAYYNEWARPQDWINIASLGITRSKRSSSGIGFWRSARSVEFSPADQALLKSVAPHFERVARVQFLMDNVRDAAICIGQGVGEAGVATFLITADRRILFANRAAEGILRRSDPLRSESGQLAGVTAAVTQALETVASGIDFQAADEIDAPGATLALACRMTDETLTMHVVPIGRRGAATFLNDERFAAAVFVVLGSIDHVARSQAFSERFGLTRAETKVLQRIIDGDGLVRGAAKLGLSEATARTHAQHIFAKANVSGQMELIRLYFEKTLAVAD